MNIISAVNNSSSMKHHRVSTIDNKYTGNSFQVYKYLFSPSDTSWIQQFSYRTQKSCRKLSKNSQLLIMNFPSLQGSACTWTRWGANQTWQASTWLSQHKLDTVRRSMQTRAGNTRHYRRLRSKVLTSYYWLVVRLQPGVDESYFKIPLQRRTQHHNGGWTLVGFWGEQDELRRWISYATSRRNDELQAAVVVHDENYGALWVEACGICLRQGFLLSGGRSTEWLPVSILHFLMKFFWRKMKLNFDENFSLFRMMNTLAKFFKESDIDFSAFTIASNVTSSSSHLLEDLMNKGRESGSEWRFFWYYLFFISKSIISRVCRTGLHLL